METKSVYDLVEERLTGDLKQAKIDDVVQIDANGKLSFELLLEDEPLTYDMLDQVAETFRTDKISVKHEKRERPLSDVTWDSYGVIILEVRAALVPDPPPPPPPPPGPKRGYLIVAGGPILASAWARGRQCQKDEAYYVGSVAEVDHLPPSLYKIVVVGPPSKNKDKTVAALVKLGYKMLEE